MKLVLISDTHTCHPDGLPAGDVLVHAGDLCAKGTLQELSFALAWLRRQRQYRHVVFTGGNHDYPLEAFMKEDAEDKFRHGFCTRRERPWLHYLRDTEVVIDDKRFYGAPWTPRYEDMAFNVSRGPAMAAKWAKIPSDTDVLVTHTPPYGILDYYFDKRLGCHDLGARLQQLHALKVHVFGHIHSGYGYRDFRDTQAGTGPQFFNACSTSIVSNDRGDRYYSSTNAPWIVEI